MTKIIRKISLVIIFLISFLYASTAQILIKADDGSIVKVTVTPKSVYVYGGNNCKWGYNYDIIYDYKVEFVGSKIPTLYTLQGYIVTEDASLFFSLPKNASSGSDRTNGHAWTNKTDCASASLKTTYVKDVQIVISGAGIPSQTISVSSTLPVEMISFNGSRTNNSIDLTWKTATEINNDYFTVERSNNGIDYEFIANIKGAGNSNQVLTYSYSDLSADSRTYYYRVKQTDFDGKYTYSNIISVIQTEKSDKAISVYPNPSETNQIQFNATSPEPYSLTILTVSGQTIYTQNLNSSQISLPELAKGFYVLQFKNNTTSEVQNVKYLQK